MRIDGSGSGDGGGKHFGGQLRRFTRCGPALGGDGWGKVGIGGERWGLVGKGGGIFFSILLFIYWYKNLVSHLVGAWCSLT